SALMWNYAEHACADAHPTPMLIMHGDRDTFFPSDGGAPQGAPSTSGAHLLSAAATADLWRRINGSTAPVAFVNVPGGEHDWFHDGAGYQLNKQGVEASAVIDQFFFDQGAFTPPQARGAARPRSWIVYVPPSYNPSRPTPVVILLHGRPSNAPAMAAI